MTAKLYWFGLVVITAAYLGVRIATGGDTIDFKYIWLAGDLWGDGINPYSGAFVARGETLFQGGNIPLFWVYPPNWWLISSAFGAMPYEVAGLVWRSLSAASLLVGCATVSHTMLGQFQRTPPLVHLAFWLICATMSATAISLSLGQTSMLMFLGVSLFVSALLRENRSLMAVSLVILALKPTLGLAIAAALFPNRRWWPAIVVAGGATVLLTLPAVFQHGLAEVFGNMLDRLRDYGQTDVNRPPEMTGIRHLADRLFGIELGTFQCLAMGILTNILFGFVLYRASPGATVKLIIAGILVSTGFFVPLHTYDLIFICLVVVLLSGQPIPLQLICVGCVAVVWRANNIEGLSGFTDPATVYFQGGLFSSLALLCAFLILSIFVGIANVGRDSTNE